MNMLVQAGQLDLGHVQADELWVKLVGRNVWMALALAVPTRLWLGGEVSPRRDLPFITRLITRVRACAADPRGDLCGWLGQLCHGRATRCFGSPSARGSGDAPLDRRSWCRAGAGYQAPRWPALGRGRAAAGAGERGGVQQVLAETGTGRGINTAYIERLNATFRGALAPLVRRSRRLLQQAGR